jgi:hypothetical protein
MAMAAARMVRDRPAQATLWGGPPSAVAGVAEGTLRVARCEGATVLVGVRPNRTAVCGRIVLLGGGAAEVRGDPGAVKERCPSASAVASLAGDVHQDLEIPEWEMTCAHLDGSAFAGRVMGGGSLKPFEMPRVPSPSGADRRRFALHCHPRGFIRAVHFYDGENNALRGLRVECATLTTPR